MATNEGGSFWAKTQLPVTSIHNRTKVEMGLRAKSVTHLDPIARNANRTAVGSRLL